jgi:hypothetical protein
MARPITRGKAGPPTSPKAGAPSGHRIANPPGTGYTQKPTQRKTSSGYTRTAAATPRKS